MVPIRQICARFSMDDLPRSDPSPMRIKAFTIYACPIIRRSSIRPVAIAPKIAGVRFIFAGAQKDRIGPLVETWVNPEFE